MLLLGDKRVILIFGTLCSKSVNWRQCAIWTVPRLLGRHWLVPRLFIKAFQLVTCQHLSYLSEFSFIKDGQIGHNSTIAGVGTSGPNRDLFQERSALSGIAGTTYEPYQRTRHHRTQHLQVGEGGVLRLDPGKPGVGGRPLFYKPVDSWESSKAGDERLGWSSRPASAPSKGKPNWIARDKQVKSSP